MNILFLDCVAGISGDMALAALLDLGADFDFVRDQVALVLGDEVILEVEKVDRGGIRATNLVVSLSPDASPPLRHWREIRERIAGAGLPEAVAERALRIFTLLAEAEARVHGTTVDDVHFHEVGAWDSIADIVGVAAAVTDLGVEWVECSPVPVGSGFIDTAHGRLPAPAPATSALLEGNPVVASGLPTEITTPTGAAIIKALVDRFAVGPDMALSSVGWGAGKKKLADRPNVLRAWLGVRASGEGEDVWLLETNLDDASPEWLGYALERLLDAGALDGWFTPIQMKKNRPGTLLSVLCPAGRLPQIRALLFAETTAIGLRERAVRRTVLERQWVEVSLPQGSVRVKLARFAGKVVNAAPEYKDLRRLADESGVPLKQLHAAAMAAWLKRSAKPTRG